MEKSILKESVLENIEKKQSHNPVSFEVLEDEDGTVWIRKKCHGEYDKLDREQERAQELNKAFPFMFAKTRNHKTGSYEIEGLYEKRTIPSLEEQKYILNTFRNKIWTNPVTEPEGVDKIKNLEEYCSTHPQLSELLSLFREVLGDDWLKGGELIHGDCTWENLLTNPNSGRFVFIDPVKDDLKIPNSRYVDIGKMMQSFMGYEIIARKSREMPEGYEPFPYLDLLTFEEKMYGIFWLAVHMHRILNRIDDTDQKFYMVVWTELSLEHSISVALQHLQVLVDNSALSSEGGIHAVQ